MYKVGYGDSWLRRGRLDAKPRLFHHPCEVRKAMESFEKRFPIHAGEAKIFKFIAGKVKRVTSV